MRTFRWGRSAALALTLLAPSAAAGSEGLRQHALELVNSSRGEHGLEPLKLEEGLSEAAQAHADDMLRRDYYAHESPEGDTVRDRYRRAGGEDGRAVAENIARSEGPAQPPEPETVERLHRGWMNSPGHRENILGNFTGFGFGLAHSGNRLYAVQTFAGPGSPLGDGEARPIGPAEQSRLAADILNRAREQAGASPLRSAAEVSETLRAAMPEPAAELAPAPLLSAVRQRHPEAAGIAAGRCSGCGARPTDADVRFFMDQWLKDGPYRDMLLDSGYGRLGFAVTADGTGRKHAAAVVMRR